MPASFSAERLVPNAPRVVWERGPRVELDTLEHGEERQCLNEIKTDLVEPVDGLKLDRHLIRPALRIKFDAGSQYMIRALNSQIGGKHEFAVRPSAFPHPEFLSSLCGASTIGGLADTAEADERIVICALCDAAASPGCRNRGCPHTKRGAR
jgi:hypothetical protein